MKNKKILAYAFFPVIAFGLLGAGSVSAHGFFGGFGSASPDEFASRHETMFQSQASLLGISLDEIKNAWADGKSFVELAKSKGLTEEQLKVKLKEARQAEFKIQLQTLVVKGIITQAQADKRLSLVQAKLDKMHGKMSKRIMRGLHF